LKVFRFTAFEGNFSLPMRKRLLIFIAGCLYYSGAVAVARWLARLGGRHLVILNYHQATGGDLCRHLLYLRQHYRIMHIEAALEELYASERCSHDRRTPLVLTFDDGYRDNYTHALALARQWHIPISVYLVPGYIESGAHFWWLEGERLVQHAQVSVVVVEGRAYQLAIEQERAALIDFIDTRVRSARSVAERERFLASIYTELAVSTDGLSQEEEAALPLSWEQIVEMEKSGWVSFGAHTMHHPILAYLTDDQEVQQEVEACRSVVERHLGHPVRSFAYPVGQMQHIGEGALEAVKRAGYCWAVTTRYGFNTPQSHPHLLRRIEVDVSQHWLVVASEAAGLWGLFARVRWLPLVRRYLTKAGKKQSSTVR
jgi:peptidoglycan/xylan/chitin deacetylase (PgdA/CDA1 family)